MFLFGHICLICFLLDNTIINKSKTNYLIKTNEKMKTLIFNNLGNIPIFFKNLKYLRFLSENFVFFIAIGFK
jgi:hypothetical protein